MSVEFPKDRTETLAVDDFAAVVRAAFLQAVDLKPNVTKIDWEGPTKLPSVAACCPPPQENLNEEGLKYHAERDRDALDMLILTAYQIGYENGYRSQEQSLTTYKLIVEVLTKGQK